MKRYDVSYKMRNPRYPDQITFLKKWARETISARGIVHAGNLAKDHLRELKKIASDDLSIEWIREVHSSGGTE